MRKSNTLKKIASIAVVTLMLALVCGMFTGCRKPETGDDPSKETEKPTEEVESTIRFPYTITGTNLVIEQINSYDGIFFEDGSNREVSKVTAIVLANKGDTCVEFVDITMKRDDTELRFVGSTLDAGAKMIILEADGKNVEEGKYTDCTAEVATVDALEMSEDQVRVEEYEKGGLLVTNLSEEDITCIRIFYKYYMADMNVYVGGITYVAKVLDLVAGEMRIVKTSRYYPDYSKVVMVKTYATKE